VDFDIVDHVAPGTDVLVIGSDDDQNWYQIQLDDATKGWVPATLVALAEWTGTGDVSPMIDVQQTATALMVTMTPTPGIEATTRPNLSADDCPASLDNVVYITLYETETWFRLSRQFDVPVDDLVALNCLESAQPLQRGDEIILPADVVVRPVASHTLVIAAQDIPLGTIITEEMLYTTTTDETTFERIQQTAGSPLRQNLADVVGQQTRTLIQRNQPLEYAAIGTPVECATDTVSDMNNCSLLPDNHVAVIVPAHAVTKGLPGAPVPGQRVDVLHIEQQTTSDGAPDFVFDHLALNAQVLIVEQEAESSIVTLAVPQPQSLLTFTRLIESTENNDAATFILIPHIETDAD
jgi:Flp pilus assembly protein CpaB